MNEFSLSQEQVSFLEGLGLPGADRMKPHILRARLRELFSENPCAGDPAGLEQLKAIARQCNVEV